MANTFTLIASVSLTTSTAAIDFTSIPATYTDLLVLVSARSVRAQTQDGMNIKFNASTTSFTGTYLAAIGSAGPQSGTLTTGAGSIPAANATSSTFSNHSIYIPNYASSNNKSYSIDSVRENNSSTVFELDLIAGLWSNSAAITSIGFFNDNANFEQYTNAYLYGIKNS